MVGGMLIQLINHADRVKVACLAQLVNVIAPISTEQGGPAWRQTIYYPLLHASTFGRGVALRPVVRSDTYDTEGREQVPYLSCACVTDPESGALTLFAVNRSTDEPLALSADLRAFGRLEAREWTVVRHDDLDAINTAATPDAVAPTSAEGASVADGTLEALLEPTSWNVIRLYPV